MEPITPVSKPKDAGDSPLIGLAEETKHEIQVASNDGARFRGSSMNTTQAKTRSSTGMTAQLVASTTSNASSSALVTVTTAPSTAANTAIAPQAPPTQPRKVYRNKNGNKWVTREIAALDFLLGIPLAAEERIVNDGWFMQQKQEQEMDSDEDDPSDKEGHDSQINLLSIPRDVVVSTGPSSANISKMRTATDTTAKGRWWEKWLKDVPTKQKQALNDKTPDAISNVISNNSRQLVDDTELELPVPAERQTNNQNFNNAAAVSAYVPGRRLEGDEAVRIHIPVTTKTLTKQRTIARQAALREWELQTAHGLKHTTTATKKNNSKNMKQQQQQQQHPPMLDGRLFFSASGSYPLSVFSLIRYEPKKEEMQQRRQKLEARGGGGTQFVMPVRDWRGISYRALLPRRKNDQVAFNRFLRENQQHSQAEEDEKNSNDPDEDDSTSISSDSSDDSYEYEPGLLDDPLMDHGRHRNVMIGDRVTGPMVSSTIQFVKPTLLKAELNKQFRERFDGWEPPRAARKYIGAKVVEGQYQLMDPTEDYEESQQARSRQGSITSAGSSSDGQKAGKEKQLRIPPSLTLSKIRSIKEQALMASIKAGVEVATVALACVYFERLCLDCRVDKSNRRLTFACCLLLALKLNEPNVGLVMKTNEKDTGDGVASRLQSLVRPNKRSRNIFASLLEFFTTQWNLSLKQLFDAEWGVFAALGFSLHEKPSHVAFHYKRLMKNLDWNPRKYLGEVMYDQWQSALEDEEERRRERQKRKDKLQRRKEERIINLRIEMEKEVFRQKTENTMIDEGGGNDTDVEGAELSALDTSGKDETLPRRPRGRLLRRFRRMSSKSSILASDNNASDVEQQRQSGRGPKRSGMHFSPSMPSLATENESPITSNRVSESNLAALRGATEEFETSSVHSFPTSEKGIIL